MPAKSNKSAADKLAEREADGTRTGAEARGEARPRGQAEARPESRNAHQGGEASRRGATWEEIRTATGCGSSGWFKRRWARSHRTATACPT
jgi:hypothetical protein